TPPPRPLPDDAFRAFSKPVRTASRRGDEPTSREYTPSPPERVPPAAGLNESPAAPGCCPPQAAACAADAVTIATLDAPPHVAPGSAAGGGAGVASLSRTCTSTTPAPDICSHAQIAPATAARSTVAARVQPLQAEPVAVHSPRPPATAAPSTLEPDVQHAHAEVVPVHTGVQPGGSPEEQLSGESSTTSSTHAPETQPDLQSRHDRRHSAQVSPRPVLSQHVLPAEAHPCVAAVQGQVSLVAESPSQSVEWERWDAAWPRSGTLPLGAPRDDWDHATLDAKIATRASGDTREPLGVEEVLARQQYMAIAGDAWPSPGGLPAEPSRLDEESVDARSPIDRASYDGDSSFEVPVDGRGKDAEILRRALIACDFVDGRYVSSSRASSPPCTSPGVRSVRSSSVSSAATDPLDLSIDEDSGLSEYEDVLDAAKRDLAARPRQTLFQPNEEWWPTIFVWHGRGDVAAFGLDTRRDNSQGGLAMVDILRDVPMEYDRREQIATLRASAAPRGRRAAPQHSSSARATARTNPPAPTSAPTSSAPSQPPRVAPDRSEPASSSEPSGGRVSRHQADDLDRARSQQMTAQAAVQQAQTRTFYLKWWHKNDEPAKYIQVTAPNWPLFHPKESEHLVNRFKVDTEFFEVFDWVSDTWVSCWKDSPSQRVDVRPPQIMHYRSEGVTHAPDMPGSETRGVKRAHDQIDYGAVPEWLSLPRTPVNRRTASSAFG
ncbi:hypothetical protein K466DRAFT_571112, partial [Polyporus arcularius HHB13444]